MNSQTLPAVCLLLAALALPAKAAKPNEAIPWNVHPDPSPHPIDWTPKADLNIDLRPLGGSVVHPPALTPYVLINATWLNQESPVYDLRTGEITAHVERATERKGAGLFCALSPNGKWVAMTRRSASPTVWSTESGKKILHLEAPGDQRIQFADDQRLITFHGQYGVKIWSVPEGNLLVEFDLPRSAYKLAMDTTPGGNYLLVVVDNPRPPQIVAIDLRTGKIEGEVPLPPGRSSYWIYNLAVSSDGASFACLWANRDGAFLTAWEMEEGHQIVQHRLGDSWKEFAGRFDQTRLPRGDWDAAKLCWKPDGSGWLVTAAIHVDRETGTASPILLPKPWFGSQGDRTPRHLPGNYILNVLGERPEGLLTVVEYDPKEFPKLRQTMKAGYLPEDFSRPELCRLPPADALPLRPLSELAEAVPAYAPLEAPIAAPALPERVELEFPPKHEDSRIGIGHMWQPTECSGNLFVSFTRQSTNDTVFWYLSRYDCRSQKETGRFTAPFQARPVDVSPSGKTVLTRTDDGRFDLWRFNGEHLLGFRPQWPVPRRLYSLRNLPVALLDDERFLQVDDSRAMVIRALPDGKAVHRVATEFGRYDLPSFDRRAVLLFRKFGWDVFNVDTGEIAHQITLPKNVQGLHHQAVFSPSGKQVALILPIELPERMNKNPDAVQGRLSRSLSVIDVASGRETTSLSLPQRYKKSPLWVSEDFLLIDSPFVGPPDSEHPTSAHPHLLIHAATGWPVWRFLTRDYRQSVRYSDRVHDRVHGVWYTQMADPRTSQPGRIVGCSLLTPEVLLAAGKQLETNRPLVDDLSRLAVDVASEIPTELKPLRARVYRHDSSLDSFIVTRESVARHFERLLEDQALKVDPGASDRLTVKLVEKPLAQLVDRKDLAGFRSDRDVSPHTFGESPWLKERLNKEDAEISATEVTCTITISGREGKPLAQVERVFNTFDSGFLERGVLDDETIRDRLRKNVWQGAVTWCLNLSAQSILTGTFDERKIPTTRLDGGEVEELDKPATFPVPLR